MGNFDTARMKEIVRVEMDKTALIQERVNSER
jgi:hypothetical protein